jgi:hypothetical protein
MLAVLREDNDPPPPEDATADYSGQLRVRLPRSLHERLSRLATAEGVSLNQEMVMLLAEGCGVREISRATRRARPSTRPRARARA